VGSVPFNFLDAEVWHKYKLVFDADTAKYIRLLIDNQTIDLSSYSVAGSVAGSGTELFVRFTSYGDASSLIFSNLDDFIFTQNED